MSLLLVAAFLYVRSRVVPNGWQHSCLMWYHYGEARNDHSNQKTRTFHLQSLALSVRWVLVHDAFVGTKTPEVGIKPYLARDCRWVPLNSNKQGQVNRIEQILNQACRIALWRLRCCFHRISNCLEIRIIQIRIKREVPIKEISWRYQFICLSTKSGRSKRNTKTTASKASPFHSGSYQCSITFLAERDWFPPKPTPASNDLLWDLFIGVWSCDVKSASG